MTIFEVWLSDLYQKQHFFIFHNPFIVSVLIILQETFKQPDYLVSVSLAEISSHQII